MFFLEAVNLKFTLHFNRHQVVQQQIIITYKTKYPQKLRNYVLVVRTYHLSIMCWVGVKMGLRYVHPFRKIHFGSHLVLDCKLYPSAISNTTLSSTLFRFSETKSSDE